MNVWICKFKISFMKIFPTWLKLIYKKVQVNC